MKRSRDTFEHVLRDAFKHGIPEPTYAADAAEPIPVPRKLRARLLRRVRRVVRGGVV